MNQEVNVLALVKGRERYVFLYDERNREEILATFARYASDPNLSFSWCDAAALIQKVQREKRRNDLKTARNAMRSLAKTRGKSKNRGSFVKDDANAGE